MRGILVFVKVCLILGLACATTGCATSIRPPTDPLDPVTTVLVNYGHHSSLILPAPGGGSEEYAYGEWDYFALNKDGLCDGIFALCCCNQGTLGRRTLAARAETKELRGHVWCEEMHDLKVARADAEALQKRLEERFQKHLDTSVYNAQSGLTFVQDDESYICYNNCNHVVARWLRELGCEVSGSACFSDFRIEPAAEIGKP
jgi:hypothetical protein